MTEASTAAAVAPLFSWRGRIGRVRYAARLMGSWVVFTPGLAIAVLVVANLVSEHLAPVVAMALLAAYAALLAFWTVQRSHDMDWPWWSALATLVPFAILVWLVKGGTPGPNSYGPPPPRNSAGLIANTVVAAILVGLIFWGLSIQNDMRTRAAGRQAGQPDTGAVSALQRKD